MPAAKWFLATFVLPKLAAASDGRGPAAPLRDAAACGLRFGLMGDPLAPHMTDRLKAKSDDDDSTGLDVVPSCSSLAGPFCDCHPRNCSCASCGTCTKCLHCVICTNAEPPPPAPPLPPLISPPADWLPSIEASSMLFAGRADLAVPLPSEHRKLPLYPSFGNGYFGGVLGCFEQDRGGEGPTATAGVIHIGGVFTGRTTRSHRAEVPGVFSVFPVSANGEAVAFGGSALDLEAGVFINRTAVAGCGAGAVLEQRWYAHRALRSVLVYEVELLAGSDVQTAAACSIVFGNCNRENRDDMVTTIFNSSSSDSGVIISSSTSKEAELANIPVSTVARVFRPPPETLQIGGGGEQSTQQFLAVFTTSLREDVDGGHDPVGAAEKIYAAARSAGGPRATTLMESHRAAWAALHTSRIELAGDDETARAVASAVNSSMFYLLSAARVDWPFSTSPGGLANNAYNGHTFWDLATWQYPALAPLFPDLGASLLLYREQRLDAAKAFAKQTGHAGARFPWESAQSGLNVCGWQTGALYEQHITGDVAMAFRQQYYLTRDDQWLVDHGWPVIQGAAEFWASRFVLDSDGNFTIKNVTGPDESSGMVDDEAYTNAIAGATVAFAAECAPKVGAVAGKNWSAIASKIYLPVITGMFEGGAIHNQDKQYQKGKIITQSAVGLLQYPLEVPMPRQLKINDLIYWQAHTADNGFYTGDSSYSIAWLALGNRTGSDAQFGRAFLYMNGLPSADNATRVEAPQYNPFNVWKEQARDGNHLNFLTGAGGFLQNVLQGYGGFRARAERVDWIPTLPPHIKTALFRQLRYGGFVYSVEYTVDNLTVEVHSPGADENRARRSSTAISGPAAAAAATKSAMMVLCTPVGTTSGSTCKALRASTPLSLARGGFSLIIEQH